MLFSKYKTTKQLEPESALLIYIRRYKHQAKQGEKVDKFSIKD